MSKKNELDKLKVKKRILELLSSLFFVPAVSVGFSGLIILVIMSINKLVGLQMVDSSVYFLAALLTSVVVSTLSGVIRYNSLMKLEEMNIEIQTLEKENDKDFSKEECIVKIEQRFKSLSNEHQLQILNFVKNSLPMIDSIEQIDKLKEEEILLLMSEIDGAFEYEESSEYERGYSRRRNISDEKR